MEIKPNRAFDLALSLKKNGDKAESNAQFGFISIFTTNFPSVSNAWKVL